MECGARVVQPGSGDLGVTAKFECVRGLCCLVDLAAEVCDGKILVTLEGGYNLKGQRDGALAVLSELLGGPLDDDETEFYLDGGLNEQFKSAHQSHEAIEQSRDVARRYWSL